MLEELQQLYEKGEFYIVYFKILQLEKSKTLDVLIGQNTELFYLKFYCLLKLNFVNELVTQVSNFLVQYELTPITKIKFFYIYLRALIEQGNFLQALQIIFWGDFELRCLNDTLSQEEERIIANFYHIKGTLFFYRGEYNQSIIYLKKALIIRENYQDTRGISDTINNMGQVYQNLGEFELASKCYLECISIDQNDNFEKGISFSLNNLGLISLQIGNLEEAYSYFNQAIKIIIKITNLENQNGNGKTINYKFLDQLLLNFENHDFIGEIYCNLGNTLYNQGDIDRSLVNYSKASYIYQKINNVTLLSDLYFQLISINLEIGNNNQANYYLKLLDQLNSSESKVVQIRQKFAYGIIKNQVKRFDGKSEAERTFYEIINYETVDWNILIITMTRLAELLFEEFLMFEDFSIVDEAKTIIDKMHTLAKDKKSFSLLTETFILKMKLAVIEGDLDTALRYLDQAYLTSSEKNLENLKKKVIAERSKLEKDYQYWKDFLKNSSMKERFEKIEIIDYMNKIKNVITPFKE